jgi:hypothetical protein
VVRPSGSSGVPEKEAVQQKHGFGRRGDFRVELLLEKMAVSESEQEAAVALLLTLADADLIHRRLRSRS